MYSMSTYVYRKYEMFERRNNLCFVFLYPSFVIYTLTNHKRGTTVLFL